MRILIAEDERITRMTLARQLQSWGHEVIVAEIVTELARVVGIAAPAPLEVAP